MRITGILLLGFVLLLSGFASGQDEKLLARYGFEYNARHFPQKTPQETLQAIVKAIGEGRFEYMLAQLADPAYVDARVAQYRKDYGGNELSKTILAFRKLAQQTRDFYRDEPALVKELRLFAKEAEWEMAEETAVGSHKQLAGRHVTLRRYEERWFLDNKQTKK